MNNYLRYLLNVLEKCLWKASRLEKLRVTTSNLLRFVFISCFGKRCFDCFLKILRKKFKEKKLLWGRGWKKKMKLSDFFLRIFLKSRIFLPRYSPKESCKKWFNWALWAKSMKLGKKCISVYVITEMNGNHFLLSSMKRPFLSEKGKIISMKFFLLHDLIHIHTESLLYFQEKKYIIIWNFFLF